MPGLLALAALTAIVVTALALGTFVVAGVALLAAVLYVVRAARRLLRREAPPVDGGQPWREVGREPLPPAEPPEPREPRDG